MTDYLDMAGRLKSLCARAGISHESVSLAAGLSAGHVGVIVNGHVKSPRMDATAKIARALGVSLDWLALGEGAEPDPGAVSTRIKDAIARRERAIAEAA